MFLGVLFFLFFVHTIITNFLLEVNLVYTWDFLLIILVICVCNRIQVAFMSLNMLFLRKPNFYFLIIQMPQIHLLLPLIRGLKCGPNLIRLNQVIPFFQILILFSLLLLYLILQIHLYLLLVLRISKILFQIKFQIQILLICLPTPTVPLLLKLQLLILLH